MKTGQILTLKPKMGIIPEVTKQNYETIAQQLRELITNSLDADATKVYITVQPDGKFTDLLIADDGIGMDEDVFTEEYLALGGSKKYDMPDQIGRIGIGFLACAPLCRYIEIHTRRKDSNMAFIARIDVNKLFKESFRYEEMESHEVGKILDVYEDADSIGLKKHYTRIILKKLKPEVLDTLNNASNLDHLIDELSKILPLRYPDECELYKHITPELKELLLEVSKPWNIDIYFNGEKLRRRVYGDIEGEKFKVVMELKNERAEIGPGRVVGYFIENTKRLKNWNGLISRSHNVAVEYNGFLGWYKRPAALPKITGELFLQDLNKNKAMNITRNAFNEADEDFLNLRNYIYKKLDYFTSKVYKRTYTASEINKVIRKKKAIKKDLTTISKAISKPKAKKKPTQKKIIKKPVVKKKAMDLSKIEIAKKFGDVEVRIVDETPSKSKKGYDIEWKGEDGTEPVVLIKKDLIREVGADLKIENQTFKVYFIEDEDSSSPCRIDFNKNEVDFNISHPSLKSKNEKIMAFVFLLTFFYDKVESKEEYRKKIIDSLSDIGD